MEWTKSGNTVVHQSGFELSVDHGTFAMPYEVNARSTEGLSPAALARMIRLGLAYGRASERLPKNQAPRDPLRPSQPRVVVRKRRHIG
ncbi:MAG: hypothetical protein ABW101_02355 [Candidatus Thiodiazotropha sp.]